jgi:hypothetical protein
MYACHRFSAPSVTRREMLLRSANGFGAVALAALLGDRAYGAPAAEPAAGSGVHFPAKARNVIFLYMDGGPSQVDTFDPKPLLEKFNGRDPHEIFKVEPTQFNNVGKMLQSPWKFQQYGESGLPVSDLLPNVGTCADELAVIRSMTSPFSEHTFANYFLHTGHGQQGRPSHGAWVNYGLGSECQDLPGFVILNGGLIPPGGLDCFGSGFLPAAFQGSVFRSGSHPVANINGPEKKSELQQSKLALMRRLDQGLLERVGHADQFESAIANYELAAKMQLAVPELMDLSKESRAMVDLYGLEDEFPNTRTYGQLCLIARRLVERGVRFIEITCTGGNGDRWDQHGGLKDGHEKNSRSVDRPVAGLLKDLRQRGLLDSTLVVWCGEFGRTPFAQGSDGRDHNPYGFTVWMAGGGTKGGTVYGATDDFGYRAIENKAEIYDMHATMLHLLGVDHTKLTFRWGGRDMRLTDVHGHVIHEVLA